MMSWTQQVRHVFLKDVHATRWLLIAYAVLLVLGIVEVVAELQFASSGWPLGALALRALAVVICTSIVLADAPFNTRSHWASLPYARSAVWAAKGVMVCMLLLFTAVALLFALQAFEVPLREALSPAVMLLVGFFALLMATVLIASVERTFVAVMVMVVLAFPALLLFTLFVSMAFGAVFDTPLVPSWVLWALMLLAGVVALSLFRVRRISSALRVAVFYAAVVLVGVQFVPVDGYALSKSAPAPGVSANAELSRRSGGPRASDSTIVISMALRGIAPSQRVEWLPSGTSVTGSGEPPRRLAVASGGHLLNNPRLPLPTNLTWLGAYPLRDAGDSATNRRSRYDAPTRIRLRTLRGDNVTGLVGDSVVANVSRIEVQGTVELREPRVFSRLPLVPNARIMHHGRRFTVLNASLQHHPELRVDFESVLKDGRQNLEHYTFVLVNTRRQEAVRMDVMESNGSTDSWLLAPSAAKRVTAVLRPTYFGITPAGWQQLGMTVVQFDGSWLQESELVIIEWELAGSIPLAAHLRIDSI